jgi:HD-GYP domain-containing protein (c-di-GMP phosphodiesterase class II)
VHAVRYDSPFGETLEDLLGIDDRLAAISVHSRRARRYAVELTQAVDLGLLEDKSLEYGFVLHDVGKMGIPDSILLKPATLTAAERQLMQTHTVIGERILAKLTLVQGEGLKVVRSHHERWDGRGYPDGLAGSAISLGVRIFAVADALDAMTSHRPYRRARRWSAAVSEIRRGAGSHFDPDIVRVFVELEPALRRIRAHLTAV